MNKDELENWQRIKDHFETLPEEQRDNQFYKRAVAITSGTVSYTHLTLPTTD